jgi:hypothetical protein
VGVLRAAFLIAVAGALAGAGCDRSPGAGPPFPRATAIQKATEDARGSAPELGIQEVRIDAVTAELVTLGEVDRRFGGQRGPGGYLPGQDGSTPVWWVRVRGRFRFTGAPEPNPGSSRPRYSTYEAGERILLYDARTGALVGTAVPGTRLVATPTP